MPQSEPHDRAGRRVPPAPAPLSRLGASERGLLRVCLLGLVIGLQVGCAARSPRYPGPLRPMAHHQTPPPSLDAPPPPLEAPSPRGFSDAVVDAARYYLEHRPQGFRDDCSGFVGAVLTRAGMPVDGSSRTYWDNAREAGVTHSRKRPRPGDLAFFDNTYDRNRNGRLDDDLTHVAIVLSVDDDGTIELAHAGTSRGRSTLWMNLRHPDVHRDDAGKMLNSYLRRRTSRDSRATRYLAGELWRGFATLEPDALASAE